MTNRKKNTKIADLPKKPVSKKKASAVKGGVTLKPSATTTFGGTN